MLNRPIKVLLAQPHTFIRKDLDSLAHLVLLSAILPLNWMPTPERFPSASLHHLSREFCPTAPTLALLLDSSWDKLKQRQLTMPWTRTRLDLCQARYAVQLLPHHPINLLVQLTTCNARLQIQVGWKLHGPVLKKALLSATIRIHMHAWNLPIHLSVSFAPHMRLLLAECHAMIPLSIVALLQTVGLLQL